MWEIAAIAAGAGVVSFAAAAVILAVIWARELRAHGKTELLLAATEAAREVEVKAAHDQANRVSALELAVAERENLLVEKDELIAKLAAGQPGAGRTAFDAPSRLPPTPVPGAR